jgi:succinate dehydrogenase / fumarate reductase membrane anchor subunit
MNHNKESSHWMNQRLSALVLIPLSFFSVYKIMTLFLSKENILSIAFSPISLLLIIIFACISFYHAQLGFDVIIDDYVSCNYKKFFLKFFIKFINFATIIFFIFALYSFFEKQEINIENNSNIQISTNNSSDLEEKIAQNQNDDEYSN